VSIRKHVDCTHERIPISSHDHDHDHDHGPPPEEVEEATLRPGRFRPKAGTRSRLRSVLHAALKEEKDEGDST